MNPLTKSKREKVFDRKGGECIFCGVTRDQHREDQGRDLDIHHVVPRRSGGSNTVNNLIPVCISCHKTLENTQGEALGRVAEMESDNSDELESLEAEIQDLKHEKQELQNALVDIRQEVRNVQTDKLEVTLYVVHQSKLTTSKLLYVGTDVEHAYDSFKEDSNAVTMESMHLSISDLSDITEPLQALVERVPEDTAEALGEQFA